MWTQPNYIRFESVLEYYPIEKVVGVRSMAVDRKANRFWLIHDSGLWCEGILDDDVASFILGFRV